jgi:hypothetical protein
MLSDKYFYHRITRKLVVAFGTLFNNLRMIRYDKAGTTEIERITVPLSYMAKEKFFQRITQDPGLTKEVQITLPRMTFELVSITYDPLRTKSIFNSAYSANTNTTIRSAYTTPYNYAFQLNIYVRNTEDGTQIIEQILPYFTPDYTLTINFSDVVGEKIDVPIVLESIDYQDSRQVGEPEELRTLIWTLTFTVKAYLYGPIETRKLIRKVTANTFDSSVLQTNERRINLSSGSGDYKIGELVYEGKTLYTANSSGFVEAWNNTANQIIVTDIAGTLEVGRKLTGAVTNTSYTMSSFVANNNQLMNLTVAPNPSTANANDDFGFTETLEQYPNIT